MTGKNALINCKTEFEKTVVRLDELTSRLDNPEIAYSKDRLITACKNYFSGVDFPETVKKLTDLLNNCFDETIDLGYTPQELGAITHSVTNVISFLVSLSDDVNYLNKNDELTTDRN